MPIADLFNALARIGFFVPLSIVLQRVITQLRKISLGKEELALSFEL